MSKLQLEIPGTGEILKPEYKVRLGRFDYQEWTVKYGWFSCNNNRPWYGWYLSDAEHSIIKPLQLPDLSDIYIVQRVDTPDTPDTPDIPEGIPIEEKGAPGGVATLNEAGTLTNTQLPADLGGVSSCTTIDAFPAIGKTSVLYIDEATNKSYRWKLDHYEPLRCGVDLGQTSTTAFPGDKGQAAYAHISDITNPHGVTKSQVGLDKVDNTSDANKPVSIATKAALDSKVESQPGKSLSTNDLTNLMKEQYDTAAAHVARKDNPHNVTKEQLGLSNIDNTSDANKPVSNATLEALSAYALATHTHSIQDLHAIDSAEKGVAGGVATLDTQGQITASQLPSYVDGVVECATFASLPSVGEASKIYITTDDNQSYRWGGTTYTPLKGGVVLGETGATAFAGDKGKVAYQHVSDTNNPHGVTKEQLGLDKVINAAPNDLPVNISTAQDRRYLQSNATLSALLSTVDRWLHDLHSLAFKDLITTDDISADILNSLQKANSAMQSFVETDPTVPAWAKEANKPSYSCEEIGAMPSTYRGAVNGVASLGADGKVPLTQIPNDVYDFLEYSTFSALPATGKQGKIYIVTQDNTQYRWTGSTYVPISAAPESEMHGVPTGAIISFMGTVAPEGYLLCNGAVVAMSMYPGLATFIYTNYGSYTFFGGNGTTTFGLPDLRNQFLRGYYGDSTSHLSGALGVHQEATQEIFIQKVGGNGVEQLLCDNTPGYTQNFDTLTTTNTVRVTIPDKTVNQAPIGSMYTARPTNVAVNFCIKY